MNRERKDGRGGRDERDERADAREDRDDVRDDRDRRDDDEGDMRDDAERDPRSRRYHHRERGVVLFADSSGSIIRAGDEALEDDLPVLNAFKQFLEAERRRTRRQVMMIVAVFVVLLLGLAGGGAWLFRRELSKMESDIEGDKLRFEEARLVDGSNLQSVARAAMTLRKDFVETRAASSSIHERVRAQSGELNRLLETITALELQNTSLERSVKLLDRTLEAANGRFEATAPPPSVPSAPAVEPVFPAPPPGAPVAVAPVAPVPASPTAPALPAAPPFTLHSFAAPPPPAPPVAVPPAGAPAPADPSERTPMGVPFRLPLPRE